MFQRKPRPAEAIAPSPQRPAPRHVEPRLAAAFASPPAPAPAPAPPPLPAPAAERPATGRTLAVGKGITLSGAIAACETLLVEGQVESTSFEGRVIDIAPDAAFKGSVKVETARIAGSFEGELVASERLVISAGGRVSGRIRYARLEIAAGGSIAGEVAPLPPGE